MLTRATYFDTAAEMLAGSYVFVTGGSVTSTTAMCCNRTVTTVGTTAVTFNQFGSSANAVLSIGGATGIITLGPGLQQVGNVLGPAPGASVQTGSLSPTGTTSTSGKMMGLGLTGATITPVSTGRVKFEIAGWTRNTAAGGINTLNLRFGTGTAPSNAGSPAGSSIGGNYLAESTPASAAVPINIGGIATGLALGTAVWFDVDLLVNAGTGAVFVSCNAFEF